MKDRVEKREENWGKRFIAGYLSGAISTYIGYPLDTVKVRMQVGDVNGTITKLF